MFTDFSHALDARYLSDPVVTIDAESRIVTANAAACAALGATERALVGGRMHARVAEEDRKALTQLVAEARQGRIADGSLPIRGATDGTARRYLVRAMPSQLSDAGNAAGAAFVTLVLHDVTPLDQLAEESHRRAHLERTPGQFMLTLDATGLIEHAIGLDSVLGHAPRAWIGRAVGDLLEPGAYPEGLAATIRRELDAAGRWSSVEQCVRSDGTSVTAHLFATSRVDPVTHAPAGCYLSGLSSPTRDESASATAAMAPTSRASRGSRRLTPGSVSATSEVRRVEREQPVVLVVDDDGAMRALVRHLLERGGYAVLESASGREALQRLRDGVVPHFLVADLRMADGSGGWLVGQVGYEFPTLIARTVVISGDAASAAAAHVAARWRCPVLAKPFNGSQLVGTLIGLASGAADVA
ncbi:MAG: hybrid sensor histidine kinase/response regulator [Gemmatimonadetes bacterium]|nr:hybrid sensor histidine kinase/response regulator [Gemmatimonadota bacterium]